MRQGKLDVQKYIATIMDGSARQLQKLFLCINYFGCTVLALLGMKSVLSCVKDHVTVMRINRQCTLINKVYLV